jgi:hypothetical protein
MNRKSVALFLFILILLSATPLTQGNSNGIHNQSSSCYCHANTAGTAATVSLSGHPAQYTAGATSTLTITVSNGPTGSGGGFNLEVDKGTLSAGIGFAINVNSAQNSATHSITGSSQRSWSIDWIAPATGSGVATLSLAGLASDGSGSNGGDRWDTVSFQIPEAGATPNSPPSASSVLLGPSGATTASTLVLSYSYSDPDNDQESGTVIQWFKDGVEQTSLSGASVPSSATAKGQQWEATITPSDGSDSGSPVNSNSLLIQNAIPSTTSPTIQPPSPTPDDALSFTSTTSDADNDAVTYDIRWYLDGSLISELNGMQSIPSVATRDGDSWVVEIRANDSEDVSQWFSSSAVTVGGGVVNTPPSIQNFAFTPSSIVTTDDFSLSYVYNDDDGDAEVDFEVLWELNSAPFSYAENSLIIPSTFTEKGQTWSAKVRVHDGNEWSTWFNTPSITVQNSLPVTESISLSLAVAKTTDNIALEYTMSDIDGDSPSNSQITWSRDGDVRPSLNGLAILPSSSTTKGELWTVEVRAGDGTGLSDTSLFANVTILNSAPSATVQISQNITSQDPVNIVIETEDPDGDAVEVTVNWLRNGFLEGSLTNATTIPNALLGPGQVWTVQVLPSDTERLNGSPTSVSTTVLNIEPVADITQLTSTVWAGENLELSGASSSDTDGIIVEYMWSWIDTKGALGTATGAQINIQTTENTVVTLVVVDDAGGQHSTTLQLTPTVGPTVSEFTASVDNQIVELEWSWDGPSANFTILRNGIPVAVTEATSFSDTPLFAGVNTYSVQPQIGDQVLLAGASTSLEVTVTPVVESAPGPSSFGGLISGGFFLLAGIAIGLFAFVRRD